MQRLQSAQGGPKSPGWWRLVAIVVAPAVVVFAVMPSVLREAAVVLMVSVTFMPSLVRLAVPLAMLAPLLF